MNIIRHGARCATFHFRCDECGCEWYCDSKEIDFTRGGDVSYICPECEDHEVSPDWCTEEMPSNWCAVLDEMKNQADNEWISVKDRLPDDLSAVLITYENRYPVSYYENIKDMPFTGAAYYMSGKWWWYTSTMEDMLAEYGSELGGTIDESIEITHWMPFPEPPKE